jgi:hypothetical protein
MAVFRPETAENRPKMAVFHLKTTVFRPKMTVFHLKTAENRPKTAIFRGKRPKIRLKARAGISREMAEIPTEMAGKNGTKGPKIAQNRLKIAQNRLKTAQNRRKTAQNRRKIAADAQIRVQIPVLAPIIRVFTAITARIIIRMDRIRGCFYTAFIAFFVCKLMLFCGFLMDLSRVLLFIG